MYGGTIRVSRSSYLNILDFTFRSKIASTIGQILTNELNSGWPSSEISGDQVEIKLLKDFEFMINRLQLVKRSGHRSFREISKIN